VGVGVGDGAGVGDGWGVGVGDGVGVTATIVGAEEPPLCGLQPATSAINATDVTRVLMPFPPKNPQTVANRSC